MAVVGREHFDAALAWVYDGIMRGRLEPWHGRPGRIAYEFIGGRRAGDEVGERFTPRRVPRP